MYARLVTQLHRQRKETHERQGRDAAKVGEVDTKNGSRVLKMFLVPVGEFSFHFISSFFLRDLVY